MVKLAAGDVHLMQGGVHPLRQHAGTVRVHVEPTPVADNGLVHTALVAHALVVGLREVKHVALVVLWICVMCIW